MSKPENVRFHVSLVSITLFVIIIMSSFSEKSASQNTIELKEIHYSLTCTSHGRKIRCIFIYFCYKCQ